MKLIYMSDSRLPTEKAHGFTQCKMCEALSNLGLDVELWHPFRRTWIEEDIFSWYGLRRNFRTRQLSWMDTTNKWNRTIRMVFHSLLTVNVKDAVFMTRNHFFLRSLCALGKNVIFEKHSPAFFIHPRVIVTHNAIALGSPVDENEFLGAKGYEYPTPTIGFVGNPTCQGHSKGVELLGQVARECRIDMTIISNRPRRESIYYMKGLSVGLIPPYPFNTHRGLGFAHPVKMREYMVAGVPVVADMTSIWPRPDKVFWAVRTLSSFVEQTRKALECSPEFLVEASREGSEWTWEKAAQRVVRKLDLWLKNK